MASSKNLLPSRKKLDKARTEGNVAKSRELSAALQVSIGFLYLFYSKQSFSKLSNWLHKLFSQTQDFHTNNMLVYLAEGFEIFVSILLPFLLSICLTAFVVEVAQVGLVVSLKPLGFKLSRLGFWSGIKRLLGMRQGGSEGFPLANLGYELARILVYLLVIIGVSAVVIVQNIDVIVYISHVSVIEAFELTLRLCQKTLTFALCGFLIIGALDLLHRRRQHLESLKMDVDEFRREMRESEGDPEAKGMRKQLHQEMTLHNILQGVRKAKVVVVGRSSP